MPTGVVVTSTPSPTPSRLPPTTVAVTVTPPLTPSRLPPTVVGAPLSTPAGLPPGVVVVTATPPQTPSRLPVAAVAVAAAVEELTAAERYLEARFQRGEYLFWKNKHDLVRHRQGG